MDNQIWSWLLTIVGVTGFILAGRKVWWAWYINLACQVLWFAYAIVTAQYGFIAAALVYSVVFTQNAVKWTRERWEKDVRVTEDILEMMDDTKSKSSGPSSLRWDLEREMDSISRTGKCTTPDTCSICKKL